MDQKQSCPAPDSALTELKLNLCVHYTRQQYYTWTITSTPAKNTSITVPANEAQGEGVYDVDPPIVHTIDSDKILRDRLKLAGSVKITNVGQHAANDLHLKAFLLVKEDDCGCDGASEQGCFTSCRWKVFASKKLDHCQRSLRSGRSENFPFEWTVPLDVADEDPSPPEEPSLALEGEVIELARHDPVDNEDEQAASTNVFRLLIVAKINHKCSREKKLFNVEKNIIPQNWVLTNEEVTVIENIKVNSVDSEQVNLVAFVIDDEPGIDITSSPYLDEIVKVYKINIDDVPKELTGVTVIDYTTASEKKVVAELALPMETPVDKPATFNETHSVNLYGDDGSHEFASRSAAFAFVIPQ